MTKIITKGYSYSLLTVSIISILGLLTTGHGISFGDSEQMKLIIEVIIFLLTAFVLLKRQSALVLVLLVLTQLSLTDIYLEITSEDNSTVIIILFLIMTGLTIYLIIGEIKRLINKK